MTNLLETLASYVPELVIRRLMESPSAPTSPQEEQFPAAMLFADLSGFTILAEKLAQQGPEGAEELSDYLNHTFDQLITLITVLGGDIVSFAGDALLALWTATDNNLDVMTRSAAQCGLALQEIFTDERSSSSERLEVRIVIGSGIVRMLHIGGIYERWVWMITGAPVNQIMRVEHMTHPRTVYLSPQAWRLVQNYCAGSINYVQTTPHTDSGVRLDEILEPAPLIPPHPVELRPSMEAGLRAYIPDVVLTRLAAGQGSWLAELRMITVLFINLPDMYDTSISLEQIQDGMRALQTALYRYEGSVNKLSIDEKGVVLIAVFGLPPLAHEDDAARGVQAALAVQQSLWSLGIRNAIGVTTGRAFCGIVGNEKRREYTILGDTVNLAARLMQAARNDILCDTTTYQSAQSRLVFNELDPIKVKGKSDPIVVYRPIEQTHSAIQDSGSIIGRMEEQSFLAAQIQALRRGKVLSSRVGEASVLLVEGEAGIGKSRLMHAMRLQAETLGITTLFGESDALEMSTPFYAWRRVFAQLFDIERVNSLETRRQRIQEKFASEPDMLRLLPLLNAVLPLDFPESSYTATLTGQALADATRAFILDLFQILISHTPTLLILEDAHWFDSASWLLVLAVSQRIPSLLITITTRPMVEPLPDIYLCMLDSAQTQHIELQPLSLDDTYNLVCQRLGIARAPESVAKLIHTKAQGNPLFIEELAYSLRDTEKIVIRDGVCWVAPEAGNLQELSLPDTAHGVITSRLDRLSLEQQLTLKVASVIGYTFQFQVLHDVYPVEEQRERLEHNLQMLERLQLIQMDESDSDLSYRFKNAIIYDVVYQLMPFAQRRQLHRAVAEWYETTYADQVEELAPTLALHFDRADDERAMGYYTLAGNEAYRIYANAEAISHFKRTLDLAHKFQVDNARFVYLYTRCGRILEIQAEYEQALDIYENMNQLANERNDSDMKMSALMALAALRSSPNPTFNPQQAELLLEEALVLARSVDDRIAESKILWNLMLLKIFTSSDPHQAVAYGEQSLTLARQFQLREQIAFTLNDLAMAYRSSGKLLRSQETLEEACSMWRRLDNLPMLSESLSRYAFGHFLAGQFDAALATSFEAAQISESIDNPSGWANSQLVVGHVYLEQGQYGKAIDVMTEAIFQGEQVGHLTVQIGMRADLGWIYGSLGEVDHGIVLAELAFTRSEEHNNLMRPWTMAVIARLFIRKGDLAEAERAVHEGYQTFKEKNEILLAPLYVPLAEAELAMALFDYERVLTVTDKLLNYLRDYQIRPYTADALYLKSQALIGLGELDKAYAVLHMARQEAESLGSLRSLWPVLFLLSHFEARSGNLAEASLLLQHSRQIIHNIAATIDDDDLRNTFLSLPQVRIVGGRKIDI